VWGDKPALRALSSRLRDSPSRLCRATGSQISRPPSRTTPALCGSAKPLPASGGQCRRPSTRRPQASGPNHAQERGGGWRLCTEFGLAEAALQYIRPGSEIGDVEGAAGASRRPPPPSPARSRANDRQPGVGIATSARVGVRAAGRSNRWREERMHSVAKPGRRSPSCSAMPDVEHRIGKVPIHRFQSRPVGMASDYARFLFFLYLFLFYFDFFSCLFSSFSFFCPDFWGRRTTRLSTRVEAEDRGVSGGALVGVGVAGRRVLITSQTPKPKTPVVICSRRRGGRIALPFLVHNGTSTARLPRRAPFFKIAEDGVLWRRLVRPS